MLSTSDPPNCLIHGNAPSSPIKFPPRLPISTFSLCCDTHGCRPTFPMGGSSVPVSNWKQNSRENWKWWKKVKLKPISNFSLYSDTYGILEVWECRNLLCWTSKLKEMNLFKTSHNWGAVYFIHCMKSGKPLQNLVNYSWWLTFGWLNTALMLPLLLLVFSPDFPSTLFWLSQSCILNPW